MLALKLGVTPQYLETGNDLPPAQLLELRLRDAELALRLSDDTLTVERDLRQLVEEARAAGNSAVATRGDGMLGLVALRQGDHEKAAAVLEPVVAHLSAVEQPDLFGALARSYVGLGRSDDAVTLLEDALAEAERDAPENAILAVRYATLLSYALSEVDDLSAARDAVAYALERAQETEDPYTRVRTYWSDARLAAVGGDPKPRSRVSTEQSRCWRQQRTSASSGARTCCGRRSSPSTTVRRKRSASEGRGAAARGLARHRGSLLAPHGTGPRGGTTRLGGKGDLPGARSAAVDGRHRPGRARGRFLRPR